MSRRARQAFQLILVFALGALGVGCAESVDEDLDLLRGRNAQLLSRHDWARSHFSRDLERHPQRLESLRGVGVGWISGFDGSMTKAIDAFETYLDAAPTDHEIRIRLARTLLLAGDDERAATVVRELPASAETDVLLARCDLEQDPRQALVRLETVLANDPNNVEANALAAQVYERLDQPDSALQALARSQELNPLDAKAFYTAAQILSRLGRESEAAEALATYQLVSQLPKPGVPVSPAVQVSVLRQIQEHLGTNSPDLKRRLAKALIEAGDVQSARPLIDQVLQGDTSTSVESIVGLGQAAHTRGAEALARELYDVALMREPSNLQALSSRARLAAELGETEIATEMLQRGFDVEPHFAPLHFVAGLLALTRDNSQEARRQLERAVELVPWLPRYRLTLADVYLASGDLDTAAELLDQAPVDPQISQYKERHSL